MGEPRYYKAHKNNCLQCCLCYLLDLDQDKVLDVSNMPEQFHEHWFKFLNEYLHTNYEKILAPLGPDHLPPEKGIAILESMDGESTHAVVIDKRDKILWDPNPVEAVYGKTIMRMVLL